MSRNVHISNWQHHSLLNAPRPYLYLTLMIAISGCSSEGIGNNGEQGSSTEIAINSPDSIATENTPALGAAEAEETDATRIQSAETDIVDNLSSETIIIQPTLIEVDNSETQAPQAGTDETQAIGIETTDPQITEAGAEESQSTGQETTDTQTAVAGTDETQTTEQETAVSIDNLTPAITDSSYNCDPVVDAIGYEVGETDNFTLSVDDESPLTLSYAVDSSNSDVVDINVDENGIFTVTAMATGETYLWLTAEDEHGLVDEYEIWVVVN